MSLDARHEMIGSTRLGGGSELVASLVSSVGVVVVVIGGLAPISLLSLLGLVPGCGPPD